MGNGEGSEGRGNPSPRGNSFNISVSLDTFEFDATLCVVFDVQLLKMLDILLKKS